MQMKIGWDGGEGKVRPQAKPWLGEEAMPSAE